MPDRRCYKFLKNFSNSQFIWYFIWLFIRIASEVPKAIPISFNRLSIGHKKPPLGLP